MIRFFRNRRGTTAVLAVLAVVMMGCSGTVCAKQYNQTDGQYEIKYRSDVDADGNGGDVSEWIKLDENEYKACDIGERWPDCKKDAEDENQEVNPPRRNESQDNRNRNSRTVCVNSVSHPRAKITNSWSIGRMDVKAEPARSQGIFERCRLAQIGQTAYLKAEHHAEPSTLVCTLWVWIDGKKKLIDTEITQALGDCKVNKVIP